MTPPVALTIAGSDSGGGAGIQADLKTFAALGVYGASAITAVTAQNTTGVRAVATIDTAMVIDQIEAVLEDLPVAAVKTGMLATTQTVRAVAELAGAGRLPWLVVDPVMVASSGDRLLEPAAEQAYRTSLLPHAAVVTPNRHEAEVLLGGSIATLQEQVDAARELGRLGAGAVVVKGGHPVADARKYAVDVVWDGRTARQLRTERLDTANNHGSGCTLSSAIATGLANGLDVVTAVQAAKEYVWNGMAGGAHWHLGRGHGPLDHLGWGMGRDRAGPVIDSPSHHNSEQL